MSVVNVVEKYGAGDLVERSWELPDSTMTSLRPDVDVTAEGWIRHERPMTAEIAAIVQPFVDELLDSGGAWFVGSWSKPDPL